MKKKSTKGQALDRQLTGLFGDPVSADSSEVEQIFEEIQPDSALEEKAYELAQRAAQRYRLAGTPVPPHVAAAIAQMKKGRSLEGAPPSKLREIVDSALRPFRGPTQKLAFNHHRLTDRTEKDEKLLEQLGDEVKRDWTEEDEEGECR
jgi:hypothetical protein